VMTAFFHSLGTTATDSNCVNIRASGSARQCFSLLKISGGKPSGPLDKLLFNFPEQLRHSLH